MMYHVKLSILIGGLCLVICLLQSGSIRAQGVAGELLNNPGFEGSYSPVPVKSGSAIITGVMPDVWLDESSADGISVKFSQETSAVHGGLSAQKIDVESSSGGFACVGQAVSGLTAGHIYNISLWVRGDGKCNVTVGLRSSSDADDSLASIESTAPTGWTNLVASMTAKKDGEAFYFIKVNEIGTVWLDDASVNEQTTKK